MPDPLPDPDPLLAGLFNLDQSLLSLESTLRQQRIERQSSSGTVRVVADGSCKLVSVTLDPSLLTPDNDPDLAPSVIPVLNAALAAAATQTGTAVSTAAKAWQIPGLPASGMPAPNYAGFPGAITSLNAAAGAQFERVKGKTCTGRSGPVEVVVKGCPPVVTSMTFELPLDTYPAYVGGAIVDAVNQATDCTRDPTDDRHDLVDVITGSSPLLSGFVVFATQTARLADRVRLESADGSGYGNVGNSGAGETNLGVGCNVGNLWSTALVVLRVNSHVRGNVYTTLPISRQNPVFIDGTLDEQAVFALPELALGITFPNPMPPKDYRVAPDNQGTLVPGTYRNVQVESRAELRIRSGVYLCDTLTLEPQSRLRVDESSGPVRIYTRTRFTFRGSVLGFAGKPVPNVYFGHAGTEMVPIDAAFIGTVAAPNARVNLISARHTGAFFGKEIEVQPDCVLRHRPFVG